MLSLPTTNDLTGGKCTAHVPAALKSGPSVSLVVRGLRIISQSLPVIGLALLPKCPMCFAAYLGFLTAVGVDAVVAAQWTGVGLLATCGLILKRMWRISARAADYVPFWLGLTGLVGIGVAYYSHADLALRYSALAIFLVGCFLSSRLRPTDLCERAQSADAGQYSSTAPGCADAIASTFVRAPDPSGAINLPVSRPLAGSRDQPTKTRHKNQ